MSWFKEIEALDPMRPGHDGPPRGSIGGGPGDRDRGSVMPLVVGMVACLLLLGAGVTAATSAFLARGGLQHSCDGAAAAAADASQRALLRTGVAAAETAQAAALEYLRPREPRAQIAAGNPGVADGGGAAVELTCTGRSPITFGWLFGAGELTLSVRAVGRSLLSPTGQ